MECVALVWKVRVQRYNEQELNDSFSHGIFRHDVFLDQSQLTVIQSDDESDILRAA